MYLIIKGMRMAVRVWIVLHGTVALAQAAATGAPPREVRLPDIDAVVARAMDAFATPGVALAVVKDGKTVLAKGFGVREVGKRDAITPDTLFAIGSTTKAFTTAALAILVDEGRIHWDDKVIDHVPEFRLYDPYVTREFTIRDLLTHRSGLGPGAGDLMMFPSTDFTRAEVIRNVRHLRPVSGFRSEFAYDNLLYVVAGEIIPSVTGMSWEDFVEERILHKLGMQPCAVLFSRVSGTRDVATPHMPLNGKATITVREPITAAAAGGSIQCNLRGLIKWVSVQLAAGRMPDGDALFSAQRSVEMWSPQTIGPVAPALTKLHRTHFRAYGLGWNLEDFEGYKRVFHSGGTLGMVSHISLVPVLGLGVIVLANQQSSDTVNSINLHILKGFVSAEQRDWVAFHKAAANEREAAYATAEQRIRAPSAATLGPPLPFAAYTGVYRDAWRGDAFVRDDGGRLTLTFSRTNRMQGPLEHVGRDTFIVRWNDRTLYADAYVLFSIGIDGGVQGMTMLPASPRTDFSFDFKDLDFRKLDAAKAQ